MAKLVTLEDIAKSRPSRWHDEFERRWFVSQMPFGTSEHPNTRSSHPHSHITQHYVTGGGIDNGDFRLRNIDGRFFASIKRGGGLLRQEMPWEITKQEFRQLLRGENWPGVRKTRYILDWDHHEMEVDVFHAIRGGRDLKGLVVAEAEFKKLRRAENFEPPDWVGEEITWKVGHGNSSFARNGIPKGVKLLGRK